MDSCRAATERAGTENCQSVHVEEQFKQHAELIGLSNTIS